MTEQPVLICYDGSEEAAAAVDAAAALLRHRAAVVLTVAPPMTFAELPGSDFVDLNRARAFRLAEAGAAHARRAGFDAEPHATIASTTWQGILDVADELDAAVIVIGSRGLGGVREFGRGSVFHDAAIHARRAVLILPPVTT